MNDRPPTRSPSRAGRSTLPILVGVLVIGLLVGGGVWQWRIRRGSSETGVARTDVTDPRLTFPTPYRNVRPEVRYVGDPACAECHASQAESYRQHPMGRSLAPVAAAIPCERYEPAAFNPFTVSALHYSVQRHDDRVFHREGVDAPDGTVLADIEAEVQFTIGSGARARSYVVNRDGYLFLSPIGWFSQAGRWDLSPGYEFANRHFSRAITVACLFCHCNDANHVVGSVNRFREPIFRGYAVGCERCHGPGELHVRRREAGATVTGQDDTIVNPARLEPALRESVCYQCHLQGEERIVRRGRGEFDYRPGLPLDLFLMDFVDGRAGNADFKFVNTVEQMTASRCYRASQEPKKLGCISCHDPHRRPAPAERVAFYRQRCLRCHTEQSCTLPVTVRHEQDREDSCIACHMPRTGSEVRHASITDHRVPRRPERAAPTGFVRRPTPGPSDLVPFPADLSQRGDEEVARNLGLAVIGLLDYEPPEAAARKYAEKALPLLDGALARDRHDGAVLAARGTALRFLGRWDEALTAYEAALVEQPESETTLYNAGNVAVTLNRLDLAQLYFERALRVNPWRWYHHQGLCRVCFRRGDWDGAERACQAGLRLEPASTSLRSLLAQCYLGLGAKAQAQTEFETLERLIPENQRRDLRLWYEEQVRRFRSGHERPGPP
jgi:Flp pilus assembly protein TadD